MVNQPGQLDTSIEIVTPENIAFQYRVAGPFRRLPAYLIDSLIRLLVVVAGTLVLSVLFGVAGLPGLGPGLSLVLWFLLDWFYGGFFEALFNGQTPGKRIMQIRVLTVDGQPINGLQAVLRNVLRAVDAQPLIFYQFGLLAAITNDRFQRFGDLACGTMVVVEQRHWLRGLTPTGVPSEGYGGSPSDGRETTGMARPFGEVFPYPTDGMVPVNFRASRTMGRALAAYVQRRRIFSWDRRLEIARHLGEPLREQFNLPPETDLDLLLCGLYHRTFISDAE